MHFVPLKNSASPHIFAEKYAAAGNYSIHFHESFAIFPNLVVQIGFFRKPFPIFFSENQSELFHL